MAPTAAPPRAAGRAPYAPAPRGRFSLRHVVGLNPGPWIWGQAATVAVLGLGCFGTAYLLAGLPAGTAAFLGALSFCLEQRTPTAHRLRCMPFAGLGMAGAALAGFALSAAHASAWTVISALTLLTLVAYYICYALRAAMPGGFMYVLAFSLSSVVPVTRGQLPVLAAAVLAAAAAAWLTAAAESLVMQGAAERHAAAGAYRALAALIGAAGTGRSDDARQSAVAALETAWLNLRRGGTDGQRRAGDWGRLVVLCRHASDAVTAAGALGRQVPEEVRDAAARTAAEIAAALTHRRPAPLEPPLLPPAAAGHAAHRLHEALGAARAAVTAPVPRDVRHPDGSRYPSLWRALAAGVRPGSVLWRRAVRTALAAGTAGALCQLAGLAKPGWAMIAAANVLLAPDAPATLGRGLQRSLGTVAGAALATGLLALHPPTGAVIAVAALAVGLGQPLLAKNSGLAMVVITPGVMPLSAHGPLGAALPLVGDRVLDTALGAAVALLAAVALWRRSEAGPVRGALAAALRALAPEGDGARARSARRQAVLTTAQDAGTVLRRALSDVRPRPEVAALWPVFLEVQRLGFHLASGPRGTGTQAERDAVRAAFGRLAAAADSGTAPVVPDLPGGWSTPEVREGFRRVRAALAEAGSGSGAEWASPLVVRGRVTDAEAPQDAAVTLVDGDGRQVDVAHPDSRGCFALHARREGAHTVIASAAGAAPVAHGVILAAGAGDDAVLAVTLRAAGDVTRRDGHRPPPTPRHPARGSVGSR